jgi:hypothetical protein
MLSKAVLSSECQRKERSKIRANRPTWPRGAPNLTGAQSFRSRVFRAIANLPTRTSITSLPTHKLTTAACTAYAAIRTLRHSTPICRRPRHLRQRSRQPSSSATVEAGGQQARRPTTARSKSESAGIHPAAERQKGGQNRSVRRRFQIR